MDDHRKDEGGAAGILVVGCVVVVLGLFVAAGTLYAVAFISALHQARSRAAAAQVEQQAAHALAVKQKLEAAIEDQQTAAEVETAPKE